MAWGDGRNTKYGYYVTHENTVYYVQTPYNLAVLVEQQSNYINLLTDQMERMKRVEHSQQESVSEVDNAEEDLKNRSWKNGKESSGEIKIRAMANEHVPNLSKNVSSNSDENNEEMWLKPINGMPIKHSLNKHENNAVDNKNDNKYYVLHDIDEKEENEEYYETSNDDKWNNNKAKEEKINNKMSKINEKMKSKVIDGVENGGNKEKECKEEESARNKLIQELRGDVEKACVMYEKLQKDSVHTEVRCEVLVDNSKDELCSFMCNSQEECYLDIDEIKNKIDKDFFLDIREEYFEGSETNVEFEETEEEEKHIDKLKDPSEHEKIEEEFEYDNEDVMYRMFDG